MNDIDVLLQENRKFPPSDEFRSAAQVTSAEVYAEAERDSEGYWATVAGELQWIRRWDTVLEWKPPHSKWFIGGKLNVSANCLDRHLDGSRRDAPAIIWEGEPGDERTVTYAQLHAEVARLGSALRSLGVTKGDRVAIYLPMIPEAAIAMLACARIGAIHSVVFGGFSPESLRDRINDSECKVLITADGSYRRGQVVALKRNADMALEETPS
ncbi:MAG: AMP-binding protein, partial [Gemmatimonadales bacterium]